MRHAVDFAMNRRAFLGRYAGGLGALALAQLAAARDPLAPKAPRHTAKARSVICLFQHGGPSQMDLFDPKPMLDKHHGEAYFDKIAGEVEFIKDAGALMRSPYKFARHGQCGAPVSEVKDPMGAKDKPVRELYKVLWESGADHAVLTAQLDKRIASLVVSRGNFDDEIYRVR